MIKYNRADPWKNRLTCSSLFVLFLLAIASTPVHSASAENQERLKQALFLFGEGKYEQAQERFKRELAESKPNSSRALRIQYYLAKIKLVQDPDLGFIELDKVMRLQEKLFGATHPDTIQSYRSLAAALKESDQAKSAVLFKKALEADLKVFGKDNLRVTRTRQLLDNSSTSEIGKDASGISDIIGQQPEVLARVHLRQGLREFNEERFLEAIPELNKAREMLEAIHGPDARELAESLYFLGVAQRVQKDYFASQESLRRSIQIYKKTNQSLERSKCLRELAITSQCSGQNNVAAKLLSQSINLCLSDLNDPRLLASLLDSARVLSQLCMRINDPYTGIKDLTALYERCKAANRRQECGNLLFYRANLELMSGKPGDARESLSSGMKFLSKAQDLHRFEGKYTEILLLAENGEYDSAVLAINKLLLPVVAYHLRDLQARLYFARSKILSKQGKLNEANADLQECRKNARISGNMYLIEEIQKKNDSSL